MYFKISLKDTSFHISINFLGLYLSPALLLKIFLKLAYSIMCGKTFQFYCIHIPIKCIESGNFYSYLPTQDSTPSSYHHALGRGKLLIIQAVFFRKSVSSNNRNGWRKLWFALSEFNQKIWRWLGTLGYLFFMIL